MQTKNVQYANICFTNEKYGLILHIGKQHDNNDQ